MTLCGNGKYTFVCIIFSLWTIIQTSVHLVFVVYGYYLSLCATSPTDATTIFFYLTYFYRKTCKTPVLIEDNSTTTTSYFTSVEPYVVKVVDAFQPTNTSHTLEIIVRQLLDNIDVFPERVAAYSRSSSYFLAFLIADAIWITSAVALLFAACCGIKERTSLWFCVPWLITTALVSFFDIVSTIIFGYDIVETTSFANWLNFVGVSNTTNLQDLDSKSPSVFTPMAPTFTVCFVTSRSILVWVLNIIGFFFVLKATTKFFKESYKDEQRTKKLNSMRRDAPARHHSSNLDTSAERIRSWYSYYGTNSSSDAVYTVTERDWNSNNNENNKIKPSSSSSNSGSNNYNNNNNHHNHHHNRFQESQSTMEVVPSDSVTYFAYSDVADNIGSIDNNICMNELRSQMPWSYTHTGENAREGTSREDFNRNAGRGRTVRIRSTSSEISVTEM